MRASGDPYLQHCVETAVLLASIGANSTVIAAGLLHDTLDDSFLSYDYISKTFGAGVADLVEGVRDEFLLCNMLLDVYTNTMILLLRLSCLALGSEILGSFLSDIIIPTSKRFIRIMEFLVYSICK